MFFCHRQSVLARIIFLGPVRTQYSFALIEWLSEPVHSRMSMKRQFLWSLLPLASVTLVNVVSVRLFYQFLGAEMYALWFYVLTLSGAFGFIDLGLGTAVGRYIGVAIGAQDKQAVREYWGTGNLLALPVLLVMSLVFVVLGVCFGPLWFRVSPQNIGLLRWAFVGGGITLFVSYYTQFWLVLSQAHFDFKFIGVLRSVFSIIQVITCIWLAYLTHNPVILIFVGTALWVLQLGLFIWHARFNYQLGLNLREATRARAREMFGLSSKVFTMVLIDAFGSNSDRLALGKLAPDAIFAHYSICNNFGARILSVGNTIMGPVFHQTSRALGKGSAERPAAIYNETFDFTFGFYALGAVWTVCWHPIFLRLWLGAGLAEQVAPAFPQLVVAYCLSGISSIAVGQIIPLNRAGVQIGFVIANSTCLALLAVAGWYWGGLSGVAWGVLASRFVLVAQDLYVIRLVGAGGWLAWKTWRHLLMQCVLGGVLFAASSAWPRTSYWQILPMTLHGMLVVPWLFRHQLSKLIRGAPTEAAGRAVS
jgi:O-antigen/teichoic acid export membrane protein